MIINSRLATQQMESLFVQSTRFRLAASAPSSGQSLPNGINDFLLLRKVQVGNMAAPFQQHNLISPLHIHFGKAL
jgi:hypothetical protein